MVANNIIILVGILLAVILIGLFFGRNTEKEDFYAYYKDKQKIGWAAQGESDDGKQPRSTWKSQDLNYETCYGTDKVTANNVPRIGTFFCDNKGLGENNPLAGLYPIDFTNYNIAYQKIAKGTRLSGTFTVNGSTYTFDEYGRPTNEHMTLKRSKEVCDALGTKCAGFIFQYPGKRDNYEARHTYFFSDLEDGMEDPNTYDMKLLGPEIRGQNSYSLTSYYQFDTYRKLDPYYKEVPMKELKVSGQDYERRTCSVEQKPDYDLDYMSGTLDDCIARCATFDNCTGFNRDANAKDSDVAACQLKKINFNEKIHNCPKDYMPSGDECITGWSSTCGENCALNKCQAAGGTWIPKDYSRSPYTCKMPPGSDNPVCNNAPNRRGLMSYVRKGAIAGGKCLNKLNENGYVDGDNIACFERLSLDEAINSCCKTQNCRGFSYGKDPNRNTYQSGCFKGPNLYNYVTRSNEYDGYFKPDVKSPQ